MRLFVVRHAVAESREDWAKLHREDHLRTLTAEGKKNFRSVCKRLEEWESDIGPILTSPWLRAVETAEILKESFPESRVQVCQELVPETPLEHLLIHLQKRPLVSEPILTLVGHEPHISLLVSWLTAGLHDSFLKLKKGGIAVLDLKRPEVAPGAFELTALLQPKYIRK